jgi:hypothetical protein
MKTILVLAAFFLLMPSQEFHYERHYQEGEKYKYKLSATKKINDKFQSQEIGISSHVVSLIGTPAEEVSWISLRSKTPGGETNLDEDAKKVSSYRISLHPNGSVLLPKMDVPSMIGMVTDLNTFFVAISPKVGIEKVKRIGETYVASSPLRGNWSNPATIPMGLDCTELKITILAINPDLAVLQSEFLPPAKNEIEFKADWMIPAVTPGVPNNFQMLKKNPNHRLSVLWGNERFTVVTKIDRLSGRIISATMDNYLTLRMRNECDEELSDCGPALPLTIHRDLLLELVETGTPN